MPTSAKYDYDLVLSFAGEDRKLVERLFKILTDEGVRVFYDRAEQASLWGKDLYQHLQEIYRDRARYCVVFVSKHYAKKRWTKHELKQAQERAFRENSEYILPLRLDETELPGLNMTTGFIDYGRGKLPAVAALLLEKIGRGKLDEEQVSRLGWNGKYVTYRGARMVSYWPKQIRAAQKQPKLTIAFPRVRYGDEKQNWKADSFPCHDCGVVKGQLHVPSCDVEECPSCGWQLLSCECETIS